MCNAAKGRAKAGKSVYRGSLADLIEGLGKAEREGRLVEKIRFRTYAPISPPPPPKRRGRPPKNRRADH